LMDAWAGFVIGDKGSKIVRLAGAGQKMKRWAARPEAWRGLYRTYASWSKPAPQNIAENRRLSAHRHCRQQGGTVFFLL